MYHIAWTGLHCLGCCPKGSIFDSTLLFLVSLGDAQNDVLAGLLFWVSFFATFGSVCVLAVGSSVHQTVGVFAASWGWRFVGFIGRQLGIAGIQGKKIEMDTLFQKLQSNSDVLHILISVDLNPASSINLMNETSCMTRFHKHGR